ncbi:MULTISPECIES: flagellar hook-length control protein FliK [Achromobacter]|uniref:Flagellar hook-length control protein FliK n=1 Tax=Achromobacter spanius TaxID=217203 RepID=A0ABY8GW89_9BURK|nr:MULTISPECIES: flagellar hook-length control protein FliK [Achromobacter]WAI81914.1 flagellar hook-length control protein FliK [Achromobacter spanius]WEX92000.1 flagellar hook-length control protein FliK [Achromobacter sp. SS2-2022]WFP08851.1 flagellar hook-length control protein FliK [Achromobacter spanius]
MTAPLPLPTIAPVAKTSIADALGANKPAPANKKGPSFSDVLAQQRPKPSADSRPANDGAKTPAQTPGKTPGKTADAGTDPASKAEDAAAGAINDAVNTAASAEAGALAVAAAQPSAPALPQQTLELAAQAAEQVQMARGSAEAAAAALGSGAAVLTAALNAADVAAPATARTPVAVTAAQAEAAAAIAARDAQVAQPVLTAAVKPGSAAAPVVAAAPTAQPAVKAEAPRAAAELPLPRVARETKTDAEPGTTTLPAHSEEDVLAALTATTQQFQAPHGATAQDHLAQAIAAATQRQAAPVVNQSAFAPPAVPLVMQVATPVGGTHWGTELGQQVVMMSTNARQGMQTAELRLDPPDLGPLRVSLNIADGVASASFVSAHASVRQAIETAMPQLQQALAQAGISLGQTSVGEQSAQQEFAQQQGNGGSQRQSGNGSALADASTDIATPTTTASRNANALVDTFA